MVFSRMEINVSDITEKKYNKQAEYAQLVGKGGKVWRKGEWEYRGGEWVYMTIGIVQYHQQQKLFHIPPVCCLCGSLCTRRESL